MQQVWLAPHRTAGKATGSVSREFRRARRRVDRVSFADRIAFWRAGGGLFSGLRKLNRARTVCQWGTGGATRTCGVLEIARSE